MPATRFGGLSLSSRGREDYGWESFANLAKNAAKRHPKNSLGELH
jgi:hypothetical protein